MKYELIREQFIARPRREVFAFFEDIENLERITPAFMNFHVLTKKPVEIRKGTLIDYRIALFGLPMKWRTEITEYNPDETFVDLQIKGPYALWNHRHSFTEVEGGTLMQDYVQYAPPLGPLGSLAHAIFIRRTLNRIFDFREETIRKVFA